MGYLTQAPAAILVKSVTRIVGIRLPGLHASSPNAVAIAGLLTEPTHIGLTRVAPTSADVIPYLIAKLTQFTMPTWARLPSKFPVRF